MKTFLQFLVVSLVKSLIKYLYFYYTNQYVKFHDDMMSSFADISMQVSPQSFWFHCGDAEYLRHSYF